MEDWVCASICRKEPRQAGGRATVRTQCGHRGRAAGNGQCKVLIDCGRLAESSVFDLECVSGSRRGNARTNRRVICVRIICYVRHRREQAAANSIQPGGVSNAISHGLSDCITLGTDVESVARYGRTVSRIPPVTNCCD